MRRLNSHDVFVAMRLVKVANVKEALSKVALDKKGKVDTTIGFEMIAELIGNCGDPEAEKTVYEFLSGPLEMDPEELREMDALELIDKIEELGNIIGKDEWKSFFERVLKLTK